VYLRAFFLYGAKKRRNTGQKNKGPARHALRGLLCWIKRTSPKLAERSPLKKFPKTIAVMREQDNNENRLEIGPVGNPKIAPNGCIVDMLGTTSTAI
jgi:hypothetical protein